MFAASLGFELRTPRRFSPWGKCHASVSRTLLLVGGNVSECATVDSSLSRALSRENDAPSVTMAVDFSSASVFGRDVVSCDTLRPLPKTKNGKK